MRLEITRRASLAVKALITLGGEGRQMKAVELADRMDATVGFVPQVLGPLVARGWVRSEPGPRGGYSCAAPLAQLTVLEVIEAVDGPTDDGLCVTAGGPCGREHACVLHEPWQAARSQLLASLRDRRLDTIDARFER